MQRSRLLVGLALSVALVGALGCGSRNSDPDPSPAAEPTVDVQAAGDSTNSGSPAADAPAENTDAGGEPPVVDDTAAGAGADDPAAQAPVAGEFDGSEEGPVTFKSPDLHGAMTASGEPFDKDALTAAHKDLPFGTEVTVTNLFNGMQVVVVINDRLPQEVSAVIDLSPAAATAIDMVDAGIVDGRIEW